MKVYDGKDASATLMGTYCGSNVPTVITSGEPLLGNLYIVYTSTSASNSFKAPWKKVTCKFEIFGNQQNPNNSHHSPSNLLCHSVSIIRELGDHGDVRKLFVWYELSPLY